ncbi:MAG: YgiT-type zinc finger protein [Chloroflexota bacterium]
MKPLAEIREQLALGQFEFSRHAFKRAVERNISAREEVIVFRCHACGGTEARQELVSEVFYVDGRFLLVEEIPAQVCLRCGEPSFSRETMEKVRRLVHGEAEPERSVELDVYAYA